MDSPDYESHQAFKDAYDWQRGLFSELGEHDYSFVADQAEAFLAEHESTFHSLDSKAESLFKFGISLCGGIFAAAKVVPSVEFDGWMVCAFLCFIFSSGTCIWLRRPTEKPLPSDPKKLIDTLHADVPANQLPCIAAANNYVAAMGLQFVNNQKATYVQSASILVVLGLLLLFMSLVT